MIAYARLTRSLSVAFVAPLPLLIVYNVGLMMPQSHVANLLDILSTRVVSLFGRMGFFYFNLVLTLATVAMIVYLARNRRLKPRHWFLMAAEGLGFGLLHGLFVVYVMKEAHLLGARTPEGLSLMDRIAASAGAGYWEELAFRVVMIGLPLKVVPWLMRKRGAEIKKLTLVGLGAVLLMVSSLAFSLAHYVGAEAFSWYTFVYRTLGGTYFGTLFLLRGFAVTAYAHFFYDVIVMS